MADQDPCSHPPQSHEEDPSVEREIDEALAPYTHAFTNS